MNLKSVISQSVFERERAFTNLFERKNPEKEEKTEDVVARVLRQLNFPSPFQQQKHLFNRKGQ